MITILSPAKALDFEKPVQTNISSQPLYQNEAQQLVEKLKKFNKTKLMDLMDVSDKLAKLNYERFQLWSLPFSQENSRQAILAFNGEVYNGLKAGTLEQEGLDFAQKHVRILSGLHGILYPLDLVQPYRLEMGTRLALNGKKNLYEFWGDKINRKLNEDLKHHKSKVLVNLASAEYSKAAILNKINFPVITPVFKELKGNEYKIVFVYTKKARGLMTRFIIDNKIDTAEELKLFDTEGYFYNENLSDEKTWVFVR